MRILITGVTGTMGQELTQLLLNEGCEVVGISRDEQKQRTIKPHKNLRLKLADIRDYTSVTRAIGHQSFDKIFHLAALKCVDTLEFNVFEAINTNVLGTQNMVDIANEIGARLILASTDKACYPINAYGNTKALAEKIALSNGHTVCRYGNVIGSRGSFLPQLIKTLREEERIDITDMDMTRFWMKQSDVAKFLMLSSDADAGLIIPKNPLRISVLGMARHIANILDIEDYGIEVIGIRPGEKIHETLRTHEEGGLITSQILGSEDIERGHKFLDEVMEKYL